VVFPAFVRAYSGGSAPDLNGVPCWAKKHLNHEHTNIKEKKMSRGFSGPTHVKNQNSAFIPAADKIFIPFFAN